MGRLISCLILFLLLMAPAKPLLAQTDPFLSSFTVFTAEYKVYLNPVISAGRICSGIEFQRSENGLSFYKIGEIEGNCGSIQEPVSYVFVDESPLFNRIAYYRVELRGFGYSEVREIEVVDTRVSGFQIRPNPFMDHTTIHFDNPNSERLLFRMYSKDILVIETETMGDSVPIDGQPFRPGIYFFVLNGEDGIVRVKGRLLKL